MVVYFEKYKGVKKIGIGVAKFISGAHLGEKMAAPCPSAEVHFAQKLAANEKRTRDIAFKKLKKWLQSRTTDGKGKL